MSTLRALFVLCAAILIAGAAAEAQSLAGRHQVELHVGIWNQTASVTTEVGAGGVSTSVGASGFLGGLAYGYWLQESVSLRVSAGAMAASVDTDIDGSGVSSEVASITQLLFGMRYYFPRSTYGQKLRPFLGAGVGAFIGSQVQSAVGMSVSANVGTEAAIGGELGAGTDILLGRHFLTSIWLAYDLMTDFSQPIGGSDNYSGPQLKIGFGYVF
jgi:outer membrane protein W